MNLSYLLFFIASIHFSSENCLKSNKNLLNLEILYFSHSCCKKKAHLLKIYNQQCAFFLTFILYFSEIFYYWQTTSAIKWRRFRMIILNRQLISYLVRTKHTAMPYFPAYVLLLPNKIPLSSNFPVTFHDQISGSGMH